MAASECVDLTSDADDETAQRKAELGRRAADIACISLLSSEDDTPARPQAQRTESPSQLYCLASSLLPSQPPQSNEELQDPQKKPPGRATEQEGVKRRRSARKLQRVYVDDYALASAGEEPQSPERQCHQEGDFNAGLKTPSEHGNAIPEEEETPKPKKRTGRLTEEEKAARAADKERQKQERLAAREAKKRDKEADKAAKQAQREQQKLQRQRETGKTALVDITVHLDSDLAKHRTGRDIMQKLEDTFGQPGTEGPSVELSQHLPMWPLRSATWSRICHPSASDSSEPLLSQQILSQGASQGSAAERQRVPYIVVFFTAEEFVEQVAADALASVIKEAAEKCPDCTLGILVEGLEHYLTLRQRREFRAKGPEGGGFSRAFVDDFLGSMACRWPGVRQIAVHDSAHAAEHMTGLTRALAEQPFRVETAYLNSFGAGKPDSHAMGELLRRAPLPHKEREIWFRALSCVPDVGPQAAHAVSGAHASLGALIAAYQALPGAAKEKEGMLQGISKHGGQRIGPTVSKKIFQILTSDDPSLCIQASRKS